METVNVTVRMERQTRDGAAKLFSELGIGTTQAINMFLKQAAREQRIPFEVAAAPLRLGQPPSRGCILLIGQKYSKCAILSVWLKSTTYTRR